MICRECGLITKRFWRTQVRCCDGYGLTTVDEQNPAPLDQRTLRTPVKTCLDIVSFMTGGLILINMWFCCCVNPCCCCCYCCPSGMMSDMYSSYPINKTRTNHSKLMFDAILGPQEGENRISRFVFVQNAVVEPRNGITSLGRNMRVAIRTTLQRSVDS